MSESLNTQLANAVAKVATANDWLTNRIYRTEDARREETLARNAVNEAQKHFDELVAMVKNSAPRDTVWRRPAEVTLPNKDLK